MNPQSWNNLDLDTLSGLPLMLNPISVENAFYWEGLISEKLVQTYTTIKASTVAICNVFEDDSQDLRAIQIENAHLILSHATKGSVFLEHRALFLLPGYEDNVVIPSIWLKISMEDLELLKETNLNSPEPVDIFELEVFKALLIVWIAWHLSHPEIMSRVNDSLHTLGRVADLVFAGIYWETAIHMAKLEKELSV